MFLGIFITAVIAIVGWFIKNRISWNASKTEINSSAQRLIATGVRLPVDLSRCKIVSSHNHIPEREIMIMNESVALEMILDSGDEVGPKDEHYSVLVYEHLLESGKTIKFYGHTSRDKKTLEILCAIQKATFIYLDKNDPKSYYFDLRFLDQ